MKRFMLRVILKCTFLSTQEFARNYAELAMLAIKIHAGKSKMNSAEKYYSSVLHQVHLVIQSDAFLTRLAYKQYQVSSVSKVSV